jgi:hypothetical protein
LFAFHFLRSEVNATVDALTARGAIRPGKILERTGAIGIALTNIWIPTLSTALHRAKNKWDIQGTLDNAALNGERFVTNRLSSAWLYSLAAMIMASSLSEKVADFLTATTSL